jgi:type II secretion system protein G
LFSLPAINHQSLAVYRMPQAETKWSNIRRAVSVSRQAFTLVELLVVVAIIGLLSTVAVVSLNSSRAKARDTKRKADLVQISKALELYYSDNGSYPSTGGSAAWHGPTATYGGYPDSGAGAWIPNFQNYMAQLPHDPDTAKPRVYCQSVPDWASYIYTSNGTDYKVLSYCTPEGSNIGADPMSDPARSTTAYGVYSPGARAW